MFNREEHRVLFQKIGTDTFILSYMREKAQAHYLSKQKAEIAIVEGIG